ncbi:hypothetical protein LN893_14845 [Pontibacter sp. XAAS-A31]|nr:hypothetical protein [Pontibacter harenae]
MRKLLKAAHGLRDEEEGHPLLQVQHQGLLPEPKRRENARALPGIAKRVPDRPSTSAAGAGDDVTGV